VRIAENPLRQYPWYLRPFFWNQRHKYGQLLKPALLWGRSPLLFLGVAVLYGALDRKRSPLDAVLRSLVIVRVSQINWCRFCVDIHSATLANETAHRRVFVPNVPELHLSDLPKGIVGKCVLKERKQRKFPHKLSANSGAKNIEGKLRRGRWRSDHPESFRTRKQLKQILVIRHSYPPDSLR